MSTPSAKKSGLGLVGAGAAACAACCAGPVLGFLAATGIASLLGAALLGVVGLVVVLAGAAVLWQRRRRRQQRCAPVTRADAVAVETPQFKSRR